MSMNKYMHPRNIYKNPPNFKQLALDYPQFKKHVKVDVSGKIVFDFKDPEALRALSCTLLKKDFGLNVELPPNKLVPTIPLRLNYILWIEDLLAFIQRSCDVRGIDIGTGASCVYPLIAASKNGWFMLGTETDTESIKYARKNVEKNNLETLIDIREIKEDMCLIAVVQKSEEYDFCMCNPPFFSSTQELHPFFKSRKTNRPHPKNAFVATVNEVVSKGGEVEFIQKIISESNILRTKIKIYTTMVGQKSNLPTLKKHLREIGVHSFQETEFCQGNTTRWGLAWTFLDCDLRKVPDSFKLATKQTKPHGPLRYVLQDQKTTPEHVVNITSKILTLFKDLKMGFEEVTRDKMHQRFFVTANSNTWSQQRRKRREKLRRMSDTAGETTRVDNNNIEDNTSDSQLERSPGKRFLDELCESTFSKKLRLSTESESSGTFEVFFKFMFAINCENDKVILELNTMGKNSNREYLHQILQYIKNNFKNQEGEEQNEKS